jgi:hypothetical protein
MAEPAHTSYRACLAEAFRCSRRLSEPLGKVAEDVIDSPEFDAIVRECSAGSFEGARRIAELAVVHLDRVPIATPKGSELDAAETLAWWRDLLNYERGWFLQLATTSEAPPSNRPRRGVSAVCMSFSWAVPELMEKIQTRQEITKASRRPTTVLFARGSSGQVAAAMIGATVEKVFRATNGLRTMEQIAQTAGLDVSETAEVLEALAHIGAVVLAM